MFKDLSYHCWFVVEKWKKNTKILVVTVNLPGVALLKILRSLLGLLKEIKFELSECPLKVKTMLLIADSCSTILIDYEGDVSCE